MAALPRVQEVMRHHRIAGHADRTMVMYAGQIVEELVAKDLARASHPYTRALLNCLPSLTHDQPRLPVMQRDPAWAEA